MSKNQLRMACDLSHDLLLQIKKLLGMKKAQPSLLCHSLARLNSMTWLERVIANGTIDEYEIKS